MDEEPPVFNTPPIALHWGENWGDSMRLEVRGWAAFLHSTIPSWVGNWNWPFVLRSINAMRILMVLIVLVYLLFCRSQDTDNDAKVKRSSSPSLQSSSPKVRKLDTPRRSECVDPQGDLEASLLAEVVAEHRKSRQQLANHLSQSRTAEKAFFDSCALRMEKLPTPTKSILQLQICQLFFNAENPDLPPVPITPLPGQQQSLNVSN